MAFNPRNNNNSEEERCRLINLPREFGRGWRAWSHRARLGAVRGQLRLLQLYWHKRVDSFVLRAWDLDPTTSSWLSVYDIRLKSSNPRVFWHPLALHPDDEDVLFLSRISSCDDNLDIFQYRIGEDLDTSEFLYQHPRLRSVSSLCLPSCASLVAYCNSSAPINIDLEF